VVLVSRHRAPWKWIQPGLVVELRTAVRLTSNALALLDPGFIEAVVRRHFQPLFIRPSRASSERTIRAEFSSGSTRSRWLPKIGAPLRRRHSP
jgi:hypothetical protein